MGRVAKGLAMLALLLGASSCVTTTTGGFNVEASDEQALEDYIQLATAYYDVDDMAGARQHITNALEINPNNSTIYNILALVLQREGDLELAEENFERSIDLDRGNSRARNNYAAFLFSAERFEEAYAQLAIVADDTLYEGRAVAFENLGRAALRLNRYEDAMGAFERALQLNSDLYISSLELSQLHFNAGDIPRAKAVFAQYLTNADFYRIPHTPRALLLGIQLESDIQDSELAESFKLLLSTLYPESEEYAQYERLRNGN